MYREQSEEIDWNYPDNVVPSIEIKNPTDPRIADIISSARFKVKGGGLVIEEPKVQNDISATLAQRGGRYGQFKDHAKIAQGVQDVLRAAPNWDKLDPDMRQALSVIADKMARILNGDPYYDDNWHDIQGYAKLVEDRIKQERGA